MTISCSPTTVIGGFLFGILVGAGLCNGWIG